MKTLIAALIFGALVLVPASVSAQSQFGPNEICQGGSGGLDYGPRSTRAGEGFTDNDGNHVAEILFTHERTCGGHAVNVEVRLSNGQPLSTCDECRETWNWYNTTFKFIQPE